MFSPTDEEKLTSAEKGKDEIQTITMIESCKRDSKHNALPSSKARSPRINKNESYSKWEKRKQIEREEKCREKNKGSDWHGGGSDRDLSLKDDRRHGDYRYKQDGYFDKRDYYRRDDYERNRTGGRWDKDDYKYRKDRYSTSPRRGDVRESQSRDPRLRDKDTESKNPKINERDKEGRNGENGYSLDPRLKGKKLETSDAHVRAKKLKEWEGEVESLVSKNVINKDPRELDSENKHSTKVAGNNFSYSKIQDPRLKGKDNEQKSIYFGHKSSSLGDKDSTEQSTEDHESTSNSVESESDTNVSTIVSAAEIISSVLAGTSLSKTAAINRYSEDAYTVGVEACSDEEPLPPGDERDVAHEVQLDITRCRIKAAQSAVKKRKLSETAFQDEKKNSGLKSKKIQIVLKSVQLNSARNELNSSPNIDNPSMDKELEGGWSSISPEIAADVDVQCAEAEVSSLSLANLPLTEDISPCNSPAIETTSHLECNNLSTSNEAVSIDLYSDIEGNEDDNCVGYVNNDDNDDAMSLSPISSNEDTLEVNEPEVKPSPKPQGVSEDVAVPPASVVFPPYPPPMFNPSIPPPPFFNPRVPPPPLVPVTVPPPPLPAHPTVPPPPILPPAVAPSAAPPIPVPPPPIPHSIISGSSGFYDPRIVPQFSSTGYSNSGGYGYQKLEQKKPWKAVIIDEVYRNICGELDTVLKRDISKKLVEASAFKALESWWGNKTKPKVRVSIFTLESPC